MTRNAGTYRRAIISAAITLLASLVLIPSPAQAVTTPQNVRITATNHTDVTVAWEPTAGAKRYRVTYRTTTEKSAKSIWTNSSTSFTLKNLVPNESYVVGITAEDAKKNLSLRSPLLTFSTKTFRMPTGFAVTKTSDSAGEISWDAVPGAQQYRVTWRPTNSKVGKHFWVTGTKASISGLAPRQDHVVGVTAQLPSGHYSARTPLETFRTTSLATPKNLTIAKTTDTSATLVWDQVPGANQYRVTWRPSDAKAGRSFIVTENSNTLTNLEPGKTHVYGVTALASGRADSLRTPLTTFYTTSLDTPKNVTVVKTNATSANFSWNAVPGATEYRITWRASDEKSGRSLTVAGTNHTLNGLRPERAHVYGVAALAPGKAASLRTELVTATTTAVPQPTNVTVEKTTTDSATLRWNSVEEATRYKVTWEDTKDHSRRSEFVNSTRHTLNGLRSGHQHLVAVAAEVPGNHLSQTTPPVTVTTQVDTSAPIPRPNVPASQINASTTGVPSGTPLTAHSGVLKITKDGTVIDGLDIKGSIKIEANNVTVKNTRVRGQGSVKIGLINVSPGKTGLKVIDSEIYNEKPHPDTNGIMGANFTLERVNIHHVVDQVHVTELGNAQILHSWLHSNTHFTNDPNWDGGPSHDDNIQLIGGNNITVKSSRIEGAKNAAIMVGQNKAPIKNLKIESNIIGGGACSINISPKGFGSMESNGNVVAGNIFQRNQTQHLGCAVIAPNGSVPTMTSNTWADTGAIVNHTRG